MNRVRSKRREPLWGAVTLGLLLAAVIIAAVGGQIIEAVLISIFFVLGVAGVAYRAHSLSSARKNASSDSR